MNALVRRITVVVAIRFSKYNIVSIIVVDHIESSGIISWIFDLYIHHHLIVESRWICSSWLE